MQGGKPFYDREKAGQVRTKVLEDIELVLNDDPKAETWSKFKKDLIMKLATNILPRLNEHSGSEGALPIPILNLKEKEVDITE